VIKYDEKASALIVHALMQTQAAAIYLDTAHATRLDQLNCSSAAATARSSLAETFLPFCAERLVDESQTL
jgi:hypothetical protein